MLWAYEELGWGGYWGWDPVENAGLLPWFTATAFLHSVMVQERRGMLRVWNVTLVIVTFFLTIFGTFMTRSGVVQSVHAFGEDRELAWLFTIFMVVILTFSFGLVIYRLPLLKARNELDSWASREAAFLANNWILLFSAFFVLFATMFPTLSEAVKGERLTVGPPFFNKWMLPIGLTLLTLTGIGPLLAWRRSTLTNIVQQFTWPVMAAVLTAAALYAFGVRVWSSGLCFALCAFSATTIAQEFLRGAGVRRAATGTDLFTGLVGLFGRSRRRYAGYIVHLGIVVMFLGFAGEGFKQEEQLPMKVGQQTTVGPFTVRHDALRVTQDAQKQMVTGHVSVFDDGKLIAEMTPARWYFEKRPDEPTTEVAIRRAFGEDLYIVLTPDFDPATQTVTYAITVNPLVNWIWLGFRDPGNRQHYFAAARVHVRRCDGETSRRRGDDQPVVPGADAVGRVRTAHREPAGDPDRAAYPARKGAAEPDHLHVRHVRAEADWRVHLRSCRPDARGSRTDGVAGAVARADLRVLHREVRQPGTARLTDRQRLQPAGMAVPVSRRRLRRSGAGDRCLPLVAAGGRAGRRGIGGVHRGRPLDATKTGR